MVVGQCALLELKEGKRMVHKYLLVTKSMSIYCSVGRTSRYHIWNLLTYLFLIATDYFGKNDINFFLIFGH